MISDFKKNRKITYAELPEKGMSTTAIMKQLKKGDDYSKGFYLKGAVSGAVYCADDQHWDLVGQVMRMYMVSNPLHTTEFAPVT
eukprot:CAMPEP_0176366240 /NCGR_PEP_ID=MMETSP0126-20121128/21044_1 /TAXON_ID=141414 ORGANISM="Strombidinopsis acuminatum, Strain SPMC142" /NCGR_SAMPLE_ID=MMETSP0126 /ASSEMBLY_ACC=CAM_ASM_000229 /LENGTH=83 /DNA_ID=CAMNT_0017723587 /DNA_START=419 /DNA_END=670 /DNA_ORIENTATION=+